MRKQRAKALLTFSLYFTYLVCTQFIYLPILRLLGPRCAILVSGVTAWFHWLATFVVAEKRTLRALREILPVIQPGLRVRKVLLWNLALKHRIFVEYDATRTARGRRYLRLTYHLEGRERLDAAIAEGHGVIMLMFHFGMSQPLFTVLNILGYEALSHKLPATPPLVADAEAAMRGAGPVLAGAFAWAVQLARKIAASADSGAGPILYHSPNFAFPILRRRLQRQGLVAMGADGMGSTDFMEVPFLGGTIRLATGPARLAAHAGAPIVCLSAMPEGLSRHRIIVHPPIRCPEDSADAIRATMTAYVALFEEHVRQDPWAWWSWRRLIVEHYSDGRLRLDFRSVPTEGGLPRQIRQAPAISATTAVGTGPVSERGQGR